MTFPTFLFGLLVASLYAAFYHLARGEGPRSLLYYLLLAWAGFAAGHLVGGWLNWSFLQLGSLNLGAATIGSLIFLGVGDWLGRIERRA